MFAFGHFIALDFTQERRYQVQRQIAIRLRAAGFGRIARGCLQSDLQEFTPEDGSC